MVDICLLKCPDSGIVYQNLGEYVALETPVWAALIANFFRERGFSVSILDAEAENLTIEESAQVLSEMAAKLTVFVVYGHQPSSSTQLMPDAMAVHHILRHLSDTKTIFLGTHPAALPEDTLKETRADFVCTGEGPLTLLHLVQALKEDDDDYSKIESLCYWDGSSIRRTESAPLIEDLDKILPKAAWDMLPMKDYRAHNWHCFGHINNRQPYASLYTSWGCPFKCSFCCINAPFGKSTIRYLSPEKVIEEIDILVNEYGVYNIKIPDEMFVLHEKHVMGICDLIIDRGYNLNIWAYARIDTVQQKFLERMKMAGFNWLALGIESGSRFVRNGALKKLGDHDIVDTVAAIKKHGINVCGNYIFGLPDDTHESMNETLQLALDLNAEWANFYCAMAYPGSELHKMAKRNGIPLPEDSGGPGWAGYSQHSYETFPLSNANLTSGEIVTFRDRAHLEYFSSEGYLDMIEKKFGQATLSNIKDMNKVKLRRRYIS